MNVLVVGANSLLGRNLVNRLSGSHHVYALIKSDKVIKFDHNPNVTIIEADLTSDYLSFLPSCIDAIYYLAQSNEFRDFPGGVDDMLAINVYSPSVLAKWAVMNNIETFVYASSGGVYSNVKDNPLKEGVQIGANNNLGFYLNSKLSAEILLNNFSDCFKTFAILRPFFMYGPDQNSSMLIPRLVNNIKKSVPILLNNNDGIRLNPIYISDAAEAIEKILDLEGDYIFNIAGNDVVSLRQLCDLIGVVVGKAPVYKVVDAFSKDLVADINLMKTQLFVPKVSLKSGLSQISL